ncbi:universal stress protein [Acetobacterium carbinolicum]|uniref:universal stress protein n=1 Tax=Acetobacterium carbinolicum TaxID=52690 RepID=UPI0039BF7D2A
MKTILVPVDGSEISLKAADEAIELAKKLDGEVTFISVVERKVPFYGVGIGAPNAVDMEIETKIEENATKCYDEFLDFLVEKYKNTGLVLKSQTLKGIVDEEIERFAEEGQFDLIVMGRRGLSPAKRFFVGSTTRKIVDSGPSSVLIIKE